MLTFENSRSDIRVMSYVTPHKKPKLYLNMPDTVHIVQPPPLKTKTSVIKESPQQKKNEIKMMKLSAVEQNTMMNVSTDISTYYHV